MVFQILFEFNLCAIIMSTFVGVAFGSSLDGPPHFKFASYPLAHGMSSSISSPRLESMATTSPHHAEEAASFLSPGLVATSRPQPAHKPQASTTQVLPASNLSSQTKQYPT